MPKRILARGVFFAGILALAGCGGGGGASGLLPAVLNPAPGGNGGGTLGGSDLGSMIAAGYIRPVCGTPAPGQAHCVAYAISGDAGLHAMGYTSAIPPLEPYQGRYGCRHQCPTPSPSSIPAQPISGVPTPPPPHSGGFGPDDLQSAYKIDPSGGAGRVVALVEEGDAPTLEADLNVYRTNFGLPACVSADGCFRKVGQDGGGALPRTDAGWAQETSLDVDMVSAMCPNCHILVVEANTASEQDLASAANTAARMGAVAISNSYSGGESAQFASAYNHPGIAITASSGDGGYAGGAGSPADYSTVIAVGGTYLRQANNGRGWTESAWGGAGSACSAIIAKPTWQHDTGCPKRMIADVAFDADTSSGIAMYDSTPSGGSSGWMVFGGTSVGAPAIAAIYALAGNIVSDASSIYFNTGALYDTMGGSNGTCASAAPYFCNAGLGYDGPTGNGTPNGVGAF